MNLNFVGKNIFFILINYNFQENGDSLVEKLQRTLSLRRRVGLRECAHCKLIDSGDVALYQVTCPQCGEIPPSRRNRYPHLSSGYVRPEIYFCIVYNPLNCLTFSLLIT